MVLMKYCDVCGKRVSEDDVSTGNGVDVGGTVYCKEHMPKKKVSGPNAAPAPKKRKTSTHGSTISQSGVTSRRNLPAQKKGSRRSGSRRTAAPKDDSGDYQTTVGRLTPYIIIGGGVLAIVIGVLLFVMTGDKTTQQDSQPATSPNDQKQTGKISTPVTASLPETTTPEEPVTPATTEPATDDIIENVGPADAFFNPEDRDGDGLPDYYEETYDLNPKDIADGLTDQDGDGYSNLFEFLQNSMLNNPNSIPRLRRVGQPVETRVERSIVVGRNSKGIIVDGWWDPNNTGVFSSQTSLAIAGHTEARNISRAFVLYDLSALSAIKEVTSANLTVTLRLDNHVDRQGRYPDELLIGALNKKMLDDGRYTPEELKTFDIVKGTESVGILKDYPGKDRVEETYDATQVVKYWIEQKGENNGLIIRYKDESNYWRERKWYNRNQGGGEFGPRLEVKYFEIAQEKTLNRLPIATTLSPGKETTVKIGESIQFSVVATDPDGDSEKIRYEWFASTAGGLQTPDSTTASFQFAGYPRRGRFLAVVKMTDEAGDYSIDGIIVTVE